MDNLLRYRDDAIHEEPAVTLDSFLGQSNATAVRIESGEDARALLPHLGRLSLVEVSFPKFRDGRGYSSARILRDAIASSDYAHWLAVLAKAGTTFGVIGRAQDVPDDPQAVACGAIVETAIPDMPRTLSNPIRLGFAEQRVAHAAPALGQHSDEILREAGLSAIDIAALKASGAAQ